MNIILLCLLGYLLQIEATLCASSGGISLSTPPNGVMACPTSFAFSGRLDAPKTGENRVAADGCGPRANICTSQQQMAGLGFNNQICRAISGQYAAGLDHCSISASCTYSPFALCTDNLTCSGAVCCGTGCVGVGCPNLFGDGLTRQINPPSGNLGNCADFQTPVQGVICCAILK